MFKNKIVLVTGASRGIGAVIAQELAKNGAIVIGTATSQAGADAISASLEKQNTVGHGIVMDVTQEESVNKALSSIEERFGAPQILVNNAGITRDNLLLRMKQEEWDQVIATNLTSVFRVTKACLRGMLKARWGRVITISSLVGLAGNPGQANYAATKAGVIGFSKSLAMEVASRNITVNVVAPGLIDTDMAHQLTEEQQQQLLAKIPLNRLGLPVEVAAGVAFLASDAAAYITGETLNINGGMYLA